MQPVKNDPIRSENRKALKPFLLMVLVSGLIGGAAGFASAYLADRIDFGDGERIRNALQMAAPYSIAGLSLLLLAATCFFYRQGRSLFQGWNGEEEATIDRAEIKLGIALWLTSILFILNFFLFAAAFHFLDFSQAAGGLRAAFVIGSFLLAMAATLYMQQKLIDLIKKMNPEKRGSVYDPSFRQKWEESCDEAQKLMIYKAAYVAYQTTNTLCVVLWVLLFMGNTFFNLGLLPVAVVTVIWLGMSSAYCLTSIRLEGKLARGSLEGNDL